MFYRALVGGIIFFWLWMTVLLARVTWFPDSSEPIPVPTSYLWKLVFLHEEPSDLVVYNQRQRLGNLHLQPHRQVTVTDGGDRTVRQLTAVGGFSLDLPWTGRQNVIMHGSMDLGEHDEVLKLRLSAVFHDPKPTAPGTTLEIDGSPETGRWHYVAQKGSETLDERTGTIAELLDRPELRAVGFDAATLARVQQEQASHVTVAARHGKLRVNHEEIDTYVLTAKDANGLESSVHLNQLGQVLAVKTFAGLELLDGAINP